MAFAAAGFFEDCWPVQLRLPKWLASRTPARRAAALEPQPMPRGISLWMLEEKWRDTRLAVAGQESV